MDIGWAIFIVSLMYLIDSVVRDSPVRRKPPRA